MSAMATVVQVNRDETTRGLGEHEFVQLPNTGDRIALPSGAGGLDIVRVLGAEHSPRWPNRPTKEPKVTLFVERLSEEQ